MAIEDGSLSAHRRKPFPSSDKGGGKRIGLRIRVASLVRAHDDQRRGCRCLLAESGPAQPLVCPRAADRGIPQPVSVGYGVLLTSGATMAGVIFERVTGVGLVL